MKKLPNYIQLQEDRNIRWEGRVKEWLDICEIPYAGKVLMIIEGPPESSLPHRKSKISTRTRVLGINSRIKFCVGGLIGICPGYAPISLKREFYDNIVTGPIAKIMPKKVPEGQEK